MHILIKHKINIKLLLLQQNKKRKVENILAQIFVLFLCFIFSWEQTLRFRFENNFCIICIFFRGTKI
jgi:uncharacterized membrane protein